jgi:hypothetical protein
MYEQVFNCINSDYSWHAPHCARDEKLSDVLTPSVGGLRAYALADTWVPIDPSYKQHTFKAGLNLKDSVAFDAQGFVDAAKLGATVNEAQGWVQNLNQTNIKTKLDQYQASIKTKIDATNGGNATVGDVLGTQTIIKDDIPYFAGSLKNKITAIGERYSQLPESLRAQFRYGIFFDQYSYSLDSADFQYQVPTSEIAGKKITIAWVPASAADRAAIEALLPKPNADGSPIRPEQLPQGLPGSIGLKAELRVEGEVKATSSAYRAGHEPTGAGAFTRYTGIANGNTSGDWDETTDMLTAGQQTALGVSIQGISKAQLDALKTRMEQTKGKLEQVQADPGNTTALNGLTGETITGDILTTNIWSWFADLQNHGRTASSQTTITTKNGTDANGVANNSNTTSSMYDQAGLQYGLFHANAQPNKLFGAVTTGISFKGVLMDIGHVRHNRWVKDDGLDVNNTNPSVNVGSETRKRWIAYNKVRGQYASALENAIPERFFNDAAKCNMPGATTSTMPPFDTNKPACTEGISAVKAIAIAQSQGQKVFTINQQNAAQAIPLLSHRASVIDEIRSSIAAGKEVTIHESSVTANGWSGAGYSVVDPETGAGAYLIEGGARGGALVIFFGVILAILQIALAFVASPVILVIGGILGLITGVLLALSISDDPRALADFAALRYIVAVLAAILIILVEGFVLIPVAVIGVILVAAAAAIAAFISLFSRRS